MANYYVDPAAAGANNGTSWTDAWISLSSASAATAGSIVYCRGTETRTSAAGAVLLKTNAGTDGNPISFLGCDAAGTVGAGQFTLLGATGDNPSYLIDTTKSYITIENFTLDGATLFCAYSSLAVSFWRAKKCIFKNTQTAWGMYYGEHLLDRCIFTACSVSGITDAWSHSIRFCKFINNTGYGITTMRGAVKVFGCLFANNALGAISISSSGGGNDSGIIACCTFDSNGTAGPSQNYAIFAASNSTDWDIIGCRFTNNIGYGIKGFSVGETFEDCNAFYGNTQGEVSAITKRGSNDVTMTSAGYVSATNYSLLDSAQARRISINLDWDL